MAGLIPRTFIDDILARTDIVDVINKRVKLKKAGRDYQACCPFHSEKTPSFTVSPKKQFYYCFGCHAKGNAISFLMDYEKLEFVEAVEELANTLGLEVPYEKSFNSNENNHSTSFKTKRDFYTLLQNIAKFYQEQLALFPLAQDYLKQRGLSKSVIERFQIGYVPNQFSTVLNKFAINSEEHKKLFDVGMLSRNDRGDVYDRFRHRIMFPIRDRRGRTIAFGGRATNNDDKPKYLNSPESVTYHKGNELYGLFEALEINANPEKLLIVEGYMDVVALAQFDINYAVASLGTATTVEQLQLAFRATEQIICCYDGDRAGREAAWRALENALPALEDGRQLKFIFLPDGEDPDSFVRKYGKDKFESYIANAQSLSEFLFSYLSKQVDFSSSEGKAKLVALSAPLIKQIPGEMLKVTLRDILAQKVGIFDQSKLEKLLPINKKDSVIIAKPTLKRTPMRLLIALLLQNSQLVSFVPNLDAIKVLNEPGFDIFEELVKLCQSRPGLSTGQILEHWRKSDKIKTLEILAVWDHLIEDDKIETIFCDTLKYFYRRTVDKRIEVLIGKQRMGGLDLIERQELAQLLMKK
ncbi:DNA primase [Bisgaardia hudsonensis]|uniref:DNA primase n=1 Tax=Bisgaardia hudsonensis TaxID=109472 RepID=A0A4R2N221_9PAST|nr:DNA primase [Bisgaardia hudsonensis]QLB12378.1 DNA primase [Bisgaardia hudsonensis]TCP13904.1 DNA primase [Bisgaardia hudsonensis]